MDITRVLSNLPGSIYWKDLNGVYIGANDCAAKMAGLGSADELIGKTDYDLFTKDQADQFRKHDLRVLESGEEFKWEELSYSEDRKPFFQLSSKKPLKDKKGNIIGIVGNTVDISELKRTQEELEKAKQKAEEASELKSQFIMNMQHDLRTPASGVAAMLEILAKKESDGKKKETLKEIADSSRKLLNILNAILEFDSIEKGALPVLSEKFNLHDVIKDVQALEAPTATLKHLDIKTNIDERLPKEVIGDSFRMQRILINLLSNAIKFTAKGYVEINEILWKHLDDRNVLVKIIVKDTGIGIPEDKQKVIFERFTRLDPSNKGIHEGLGLGLSMVKQFVEEMNGHIEIKSSPGQGATFTCTLPFKLPEPTQEPETTKVLSETVSWTAPLAMQSFHPKILLVEDDRVARLVGKSLLTDEFHVRLDVAATGQEALQLVKKTPPLYDLIFMDIGLPDGSGCKFAQQIHDLSEDASKIPIIALTAHDNDAIRQDCQMYGMQDYLTKPLGVLKMDHIFRKWLHLAIDHAHPLDTDKENRKQPPAEEKTIDLELGAKLIHGDENKAKKILKVLIDMLADYEKQLKESFKNNDFEALKNTAHKLKGATAHCGTPRLKNAATALEEKIRHSDNPKKEEIEPIYKNLLAESSSLKKAFKKI